jgi:phytanoyl-CoA hydroxylase
MKSALRRLFGGRPAAASTGLTADGLLASDLWLDQPDALEQIDRRERKGKISAEQATALRSFVERGYLVVKLDPPPRYDDLLECVERVWREQPHDLAFAYLSQLRRMSAADPATHRRHGCRIADLHSACDAALELYLHPQLFALVELILESRVLATQSLFFEWGSGQALHRDPVHVYHDPPSHLVAAWIALEDIQPGSGALTYVPGSHRLPYYEYSPGEFRFAHGRHGNAEVQAAEQFDLAQCRARGLEPEVFLPRRGEALIWHHSLLHGGSTITDPALTRRSFVVHYATVEHARPAIRTIEERRQAPDGSPIWEPQQVRTTDLVEAGRRRGFRNPLAAV